MEVFDAFGETENLFVWERSMKLGLSGSAVSSDINITLSLFFLYVLFAIESSLFSFNRTYLS